MVSSLANSNNLLVSLLYIGILSHTEEDLERGMWLGESVIAEQAELSLQPSSVASPVYSVNP